MPLETLKSESHFEWQAPFPVMEISSFSTYISRASMQQTSTHHTQPLQLQRDALGRAECSGERVQGPDNTPTSIPKTQGLQEPTCKFYCGQKKKKRIRVLKERTPILTQIKFEIARTVTSLCIALNAHVPTQPKIKWFSTTHFLTRPQPSAIHEP